MAATAFEQFQARVRYVCSRLRHHIWVMAMNDGADVDSKTPRKNLAVIRPLKLVAAPVQATAAPQQNTLNVTHLPTGRRIRASDESGWNTSWVIYTMLLNQLVIEDSEISV